MTTVSSVNSGTNTTSSSSSSSSTSALSSDFTTFLKMLTTQMQNQDPLNPIDSSDYAAQLANFSQVEQQVKTNDLLSSISGAIGLSGLSQYANWVGMDVLSESPTEFDGATPVALSGSPASGADQAVMVVKDSSGKEVAREEVNVTSSGYSWDGTDSSGSLLSAGTYSFSLESYSNGSLLSTSKLQTYNQVVETRTATSGTVLVLANGTQIDPTSVTALRANE
ncbi:flagellar hook capping FlgD N-terminal domain-containing protein [Paenirhodobacter sp.]|uniref:flagellar hook capping FlgD N-terminal domain-containing protein n=1 Tax=Paenirhodobacter sp. TaxID=1965326 RepID=UPI003B508EEB